MILRILRLPFYLSALVLALLLPFVLINLVKEGSENYSTALFLIGAYPIFLAMLNGALIEHFITRKIITTPVDKEYADEIAISSPWWLQVIFDSHNYLLRLINIHRKELPQDIIDKGNKLAKRHKVLSSLSMLGILLMVIIGVGDTFLSNA